MCFRRWWLYSLFLIALQVHAQTAPNHYGYAANGVFVQAVGIKNVKYQTADGTYKTIQQFRVTNGTAPVKYYDRAVNYTKTQYGGKVKRLLKSNMFNWGVTAALLAIGWALDKVTGDLYQSPAQPAVSCSSNTYGINTQYGYLEACSMAEVKALYKRKDTAYLNTLPDSYLPPFTYENETQVGNTWEFTFYYYWGGTKYSGGNLSYYIDVSPPKTLPATPNADPAADHQLADFWTQNAPNEEELKTPFKIPGSDAVQRDTNNAQAEKDLYNEIAPTLGKPQATAQPVAPAVDQNAPSYDDATTPKLAFPDFCDWATIVCDFINDEPPEAPDIDMPLTDLPGNVSWYSGQGNGQCPADKNLNLHYVSSQSFNYQPICQLAIGIRPLVIASSGIFALFILSGFSRRKES